MAKPSSDIHVAAMKDKYLTRSEGAKKAIIVGYNSKGTGGAIGSVLNDHGWEVCGMGRHVLDVTDEHLVEECAISLGWSEFSVLINCAAIMDLKWFEEYPVDTVRKIIEVNLIGAYIVSSAFVRYTLDRPGRKYIVHIGSMGARIPLNGSAPYCASKAGLEQLCKCMAFELAPKNYNVLCIHPCNIEDAPMTETTIDKISSFRGTTHAAAVDYWSTGLLRNGFLTKLEIANLVKLFVGGECDYLSGAAVCLTGGHR